MEINITALFNSEFCPSDFSASQAEIGSNAGIDTWNASLEEAEEWQDKLLTTKEQQIAFINHMEAMGFSESEEMQNWPISELVALFIQLVSGDIREVMPAFCTNVDQFDWDDYNEQAEKGQTSSNMFLGVDNEVYYYLGY